jgi:hypothetical protein
LIAPKLYNWLYANYLTVIKNEKPVESKKEKNKKKPTENWNKSKKFRSKRPFYFTNKSLLIGEGLKYDFTEFEQSNDLITKVFERQSLEEPARKSRRILKLGISL